MDEYEIIKKRKKIKNKNKISGIILISSIVLVITIMVIIVMKNYYKKSNEITFKEDYTLYQYFAGEKATFTGSIVLRKNGEITDIDSSNFSGELDDRYPIYIENDNNTSIILSDLELVLLRENNSIYRAPYFSQISYENNDENIDSFIKISDQTIPLDDSFLYDGNNMYFFPTKTTLEINGEEYELGPLSYVEVEYHQFINIYNHETDKYEEIETNKDVLATINNHKINLSTDMIIGENNNNILLLKKIENLPIYKIEKRN